MNQNHTEQVKCRVCGFDSPMTVWSVIASDDDSEIAGAFVKGDIYDWKCEVCGHEDKIAFPTLYVDRLHRYMLLYHPWNTVENHSMILPDLLPGDLDCEGFTLRRVAGLENLREKIRIFENGLNDVALERLKYFQKLDRILEFYRDDAIYFHGIDHDPERCRERGAARGILQLAIVREGFPPRIKEFPAEIYYDYLLAVNKDERMRAADWDETDWHWMDRKLREE